MSRRQPTFLPVARNDLPHAGRALALGPLSGPPPPVHFAAILYDAVSNPRWRESRPRRKARQLVLDFADANGLLP